MASASESGKLAVQPRNNAPSTNSSGAAVRSPRSRSRLPGSVLMGSDDGAINDRYSKSGSSDIASKIATIQPSRSSG